MSIYYQGEMVWAKIRGYTWWPALVLESNLKEDGQIDKDVKVTFIGEESRALVSVNKIENFEACYDLHATTKNRKLIDVLKMISQNQYLPLKYQLEEKRVENNAKLRVKTTQFLQKEDEPQASKEMNVKLEDQLLSNDQGNGDYKKINGKRTMDELNGINSHLRKKKDKNKEKLSKLARKIKTVEEEKIREHDDMIDLIKAKFLSSKPEDLKEPMLSHSKETEKRNIEQDSDNNCNDQLQGIKDHSEEVQNDDEINKENFEQYETIKKLYKTEMGARKSQIVQNRNATDEYENDPFLNGHSDLDIKSKIELINYLASQLTSACEEKQGQKEPEEVNGKGVKIEEEQDYLRNALRNNLFNANIQTNYQEIQQYFSNPSMSIPVFNNFATSIYQQSQLQNLLQGTYIHHNLYNSIREQLNNTISASLINYQFLNQDYKENASDSKINEDNAFIRKIENQLKDIVDWLLGNFQITENNSSERKCSSKLTELLSEISTNMSSGSIYSIDQLKNLFKTAYNFLLKNKELTNIMDNELLANITDLMYELSTQGTEALTHEIIPSIIIPSSFEPKPQEESPRKPSESSIENVSTNVEEAASKKSSKETTEDQINDLPDSIHRLLLRRNFCCKLVEAFQEAHQIDGKYYKALILCVEGKINEFFPGTEHYKKVIKMLYKLIKMNQLEVDELMDIVNMEFKELKILLQNKIQKNTKEDKHKSKLTMKS